MAKKKKGSVDKVLSKKKNVETKVNPFEVKLNKQKHDILGKKMSKFDKGAPGLSRSKAMRKRKEKLLKELEQKDSANVFIDKRLGENNPNLSVEEKMTQRFALEKKRSHEKGSLFNLDEDIELTHYGQSLAEMEKFEAPEISDDDLDAGNLDGDVSSELFGGFLKKSDEKGDDKPWKERLQEIISKSKKAKQERQTERDQAVEMTEKLDQQWKELQALVTGSKKGGKVEEPARQVDDYDIAVRELKFEIKGTPSDRLKTEEELAQEEVERLQNLEADRQRRMRGVIEEKTAASSHVSADDLSDCYAVDKKFRQVLKYEEGKVCDDASEDGEDEGADEDKDYQSEDEDKESEEDASGGEVEDEDSDSSDDDSFADIESDDDDDAKNSQRDIGKTEPKKPDEETKTKSTQRVDLKARKEVMEAARKELPYTFEVPGSYEELVELLQEHSIMDQLVILQRMKQCNHPSLAEGNKQKLEGLFSLMLEYVGLAVESDPPQLGLVDNLTPLLYDLCQLSPVQCAQSMLQVIRNHQGEFQNQAESRKIRGFPTLDVLIHLKLVSVLFPTSDFRHSVVTPTMLFMSQLLSQCPVVHERDAAAGLYLCTLVYEYVSSSKRYFPEAINFLRGLLFLAAEKSKDKVESVLPPFKPVGKSVDLLKVEKKDLSDISMTERLTISQTLSSSLYKSSLNTDEFRVKMISSCLDLSLKFSQLYEELSAHSEIFQPLDQMIGKLPKGVSHLLKEKISSLKEHIAAVKCRTRKYLSMQSKKPQPLKMFEPKIETIFDGKKKRSGGDKEYNERQRLIHKHRREMKGAIREIRRDVQFIGRQQLDAQIQKDKERKKRVRDIHQMLAEQEGDFKALKRKKKS
ncbi:nucleolar protein 14-like [Liolophura sinensis]|uniref:nucleolar protein 14-like n=1 Tax=Liolophura sinensis TaxID=3198878 RepID=UPI00315879D4